MEKGSKHAFGIFLFQVYHIFIRCIDPKISSYLFTLRWTGAFFPFSFQYYTFVTLTRVDNFSL